MITERLFRTGLRRGLLGGSRAWLVVGVGAGLVKAVQWAAAKSPESVFRAELAPGETLVIRHTTVTKGDVGEA